MFADNKYTKWYYRIIDNRIANEYDANTYTECHHIIPRSLGGTNNKENLVNLSAREHFLVHWLLTKMGNDTHTTVKMCHALRFLMAESDNSETHKWSKWHYETAVKKKKYALSKARENGWCPRKGKTHSKESKKKMREAKLGVKRAPEVVERIRERKLTEEHKTKISSGMKGRVFSEESRKKSSMTQKGKSQNKTVLKCVVCGQENYATQIKRYHNENCKHK